MFFENSLEKYFGEFAMQTILTMHQEEWKN